MVSIDGTKIYADASKYKNMDMETLEKKMKKLLEEAKAMKLDFQPKTAAEIETVLNEVLATPPDIAAKYRQIVQP